MKFNEHSPALFTPPSGHADLAERLAKIRAAERAGGFKPGHGMPATTEAVIQQWEKTNGR